MGAAAVPRSCAAGRLRAVACPYACLAPPTARVGRTHRCADFLAFGQAWRSKIRDAALRQRLSTDVHAPADFRAETVRNLDQWYPAFKVQPSDKLYLAPKDRVKIW